MQSSLAHSQRMLIVPVIVPKAALTPSIWSFTFRNRSSFRPIRSARSSTTAPDATPLCRDGVNVVSSIARFEGDCYGGEAASLPRLVGGVRRSSLLEGPEGARRAGGRVRARTASDEPAQARPDRAADRPAALPGDPVRGRERLPRGVEGHGRADPGREAVRGPPAGGVARAP